MSLCGSRFLCQRAGARSRRQIWPAGRAPQKRDVAGLPFCFLTPDMYYIVDSTSKIYFRLVRSRKTGGLALCVQIFRREPSAAIGRRLISPRKSGRYFDRNTILQHILGRAQGSTPCGFDPVRSGRVKPNRSFSRAYFSTLVWAPDCLIGNDLKKSYKSTRKPAKSVIRSLARFPVARTLYL